MAKKSKKNKRRRHQLKKSKKGQARRSRPKTTVVQPSRSEAIYDEHDDEELDEGRVVFMDTVSRDVPVAEDGYRIVGPAQAMMDYAKPLIEETESEEDMNNVLRFAQLCWMLAILELDEPEKYEEKREELINEFGEQDVEDRIDVMVERYHLMFPDTGKSPSFYIKERVIDIEEFEPFDESTLHISEDEIPPTRKEKKLAQTLHKMDPSEDERELLKWHDQIVDCYAKWCIAKGVPDDNVGDFDYAVGSFLNFLHNYYEEVPSTDMSTKAVQEFLRTFFIRKVWVPAQEKVAMPCALKLFMQYLDEKGIVSGTQRITKIIESEQDTFLENLKLYTNPSLTRRKRKIIPFRRRFR